MRYLVKILKNGYGAEFESNSRNSLVHLKDYGGQVCKVYNKNGKQLSESRYSAEHGFYRCKYNK